MNNDFNNGISNSGCFDRTNSNEKRKITLKHIEKKINILLNGLSEQYFNKIKNIFFETQPLIDKEKHEKMIPTQGTPKDKIDIVLNNIAIEIMSLKVQINKHQTLNENFVQPLFNENLDQVIINPNQTLIQIENNFLKNQIKDLSGCIYNVDNRLKITETENIYLKNQVFESQNEIEFLKRRIKKLEGQTDNSQEFIALSELN